MSDGMKETIFLRYLWSLIFPADQDVGCTLISREDNMRAVHLASVVLLPEPKAH